MKKIIAIIMTLIIGITPICGYADLGSNPPQTPTNPSIQNITLDSNTHTSGTIGAVKITVTTQNVTNGTAITAELYDSNGQNAVAGVNVANSTVSSNSATLDLSIPAGTAAGTYKIKVSLASLNISDTSKTYTISAALQASITNLQVNPTSSFSGTQTKATITLTTANIPNNTTATLKLVNSQGEQIGNITTTATVTNNSASAELTIPSDTAAGTYSIKATVLTAESTTPYTITAASEKETISSVTLSKTSTFSGTSQTMSVTVATTNVANQTSVTANLVNSSDTTVVVAAVTQVSGSITNNSATLQLTIPGSIAVGDYRLKVIVDGVDNADTTQTFSVLQVVPVIYDYSFSQNAVLAKDSITGTITITGDNYSTTPANNSIEIINSSTNTTVGSAITPSSAQKTSLTFAIPTSLDQGTYKVKIATGGQTVTSTKTFTISASKAQITSITTSNGSSLVAGEMSGNLIITGTAFASTIAGNTLVLTDSKLKEYAVTILSLNGTVDLQIISTYNLQNKKY